MTTGASDSRRAPVEEVLADRLQQSGHAPRTRSVLRRLARLDRRVYTAVAQTDVPALDRPVRLLAEAANFSRLWFAVAGVTAIAGGARGRRAALGGVAAIAVTSFVVNQPMKLLGARARPDRVRAGVPRGRWVPMPDSSSFPSGHSASAAAFAVAIGVLAPRLRLPLGLSAAAVAGTRVYTGVHYPGDVLAGTVVGMLLGRVSAAAVGALPDSALLGVRPTPVTSGAV
jgi:undecaprenyl-diphosphatase